MARRIPVYVTRKTADGRTGAWSVTARQFVLAARLVQLNLLLWGAYGAVEAVKALIHV